VEGKMSTFGGPRDTGMSADEGLALFAQAISKTRNTRTYFCPTRPASTKDLGRRLNP